MRWKCARAWPPLRDAIFLPEDERLALHVEKAEDFLSRTDIGPYDWLPIDLYDCDVASVFDEPDPFCAVARC